ncbi:MFS transporter [Streptantibioticus cattleyicolor]|uniref:Major facilitator superfamily permease n=1 Tax=Streptantibioticus cattleyicolor (strain ATCC 35852 / DSM 46488 / JCM 4925 / NBRC 14057 / NRRL 8057) TaxID=1003195 RepID=F8JL09_STREN|nr:MFS transporter [Streptantibioticus cattleyicolor]AEW99632.1 major facilitator superfamily permease [Streptantibioticus cattleyicolor NRRL 8057 = DSM 46488]CCB71331.1 putative transmembrane efflux protein [Streptantibioticus cattleyicolor NRRL 8057 = DSM 46488]
MASPETAAPDGRRRYAGRRARTGWYVYDWAHTAFTTSVTAVFLGPYLTGVARHAARPDGWLRPFGIAVRPESYYPYLVALAVVLQLAVLPAAAALAARVDRGVLLGTLSTAGALATAGMFAIGDSGWLLGGVLFVVATTALGASVTVADAYLPLLAPPGRRDRVSTQAVAAGYLGAGVLLAAGLAVYAARRRLGVSETMAVRVNLLAVGVWWLVFGLIAVRLLRGHGTPSGERGTRPARRTLAAARGLRARPAALWFLAAFLLYNNGVQSMTSLVGTYAVEQLRIPQDQLVVAVLLVQFAAVAGAVAAGRLAERHGGRPVLLGYVLLFVCVAVAGGLLPPGRFPPFLAVGFGVGLVLGGVYALSRSVFAALVPAAQAGEAFALFEMVNRCLGFAGPAAFGLVLQWTGSYRLAGTTILAFLLAGGAVLAAGGNAARDGRRNDG